jgi:PadR family transcriptional regulator PadR
MPLDIRPSIAYIVVIMPRTPALGEFEQIVLLAILRLDDTAYGAAIRAEIAACTRREPAPGALYTTLDRLEEKGLVRSHMGDPTPERGGRAKRFFTVTRHGLAAVRKAQRSFQSLLKGLDLLEDTNA